MKRTLKVLPKKNGYNHFELPLIMALRKYKKVNKNFLKEATPT